tara:strand:+ start:791 stop:937 length:147 start_codon:yes stop_codon:yes gene_type:complete
MTVPITLAELNELLRIIPQMLSDDEAGPGFFLASETWITKTNYDEVPF